jgi:hypothetical protein
MLREAQAPVTSALKPLGFRKFANNYNRPAADGLIQVVNFQSGQYVSIFHGRFTVNLGVYIPCVALSEGNSAPGRAVAEFRCHIRQRLNALSGVGEDEWWPLDQRARWTGMGIAQALVRDGIPFLDRFNSYAAIVQRFESDGELPFSNPARSALVVALMHHAHGFTDDARKSFEAARRLAPDHAGFRDYVTELQSRCGVR